MLSTYEITVPTHLAHWFSEKLRQWLVAAGFDIVLRTGDADRTVWEYTSGKDLLSVSSEHVREEWTKVTVSSHALPLEGVLPQAIQAAAAEFISASMAPLIGGEPKDVDARVRQGLDALWRQLLAGRPEQSS